ncbi:helix-turn-helix domain-containing protein [Ramlibacter pallidus]|uniref:Helix-turn-helix domain-containing protein n=1 Tax=Ramlibacter pallidus TaxID=2780087 RepID=A0ABR9S2E1_9BURK|nr:helix-turn-helix domain-containing protein [Ramlibacter pallidus]MBE7367663.1 helix-turn-helix domain-containing protein [Ramlibacter pallidus]
MPAAAPAIPPADRDRLIRLGARLRLRRKAQKVSAVAAAEAAGISRVTLHRIESGEPGVAIGLWVAVAGALGLALELGDPASPAAAAPLPERIVLEEYPQLRALAWQLEGVQALTPAEALALYERNWKHVDRAALSAKEAALVEALSQALGAGRLLV